MFFFEFVFLAHRIALTGFVSLIPNSLGIVRLIIAIAVSIIFLSVLMIVLPYKRFDVNALAIAANLILTCSLITAVCECFVEAGAKFHFLPGLSPCCASLALRACNSF